MKQESKKKSLSDYSIEELNKLSFNEVQQMYIETINEFKEYVESAIRSSNQSDKYRKKAGQSEDAKTLSWFNQSDKDRERAFVETMSSDARANEEYIQAIRDRRYEEMIQEAGEVDMPANKLRH